MSSIRETASWLVVLTGALWPLADALAASDVTYVAGSSQKLEQFIGNTDFQTGLPTLSLTATDYALDNTDLGVPFRCNGRIFVAFGNSNFPGNDDALAYTTDTDPESGLTLTFVSNDSYFTPINIPTAEIGGFDVPIYGLNLNGFMYLYYSTDSDPSIPTMGRTVLAVSTNNGATFSAPLYTLSSNLFINVSVIEVNCADWPGLPQTNGLGLLIFGSGSYRKSDIYLAFQPVSGISNMATLQFLQGLDANNNPTWGTVESNATRVAAVAFTNSSGDVEGAGELSATFNVFLNKWMLFYNLTAQIQFKTSDQPWGPFSAHGVSFDPVIDNGFGNYIYEEGLNDTNLCNPNVTGHNTTDNGGVYGPYVFNHFTKGSATATNIQTTLYHSMSTWNPYNSILMRAQFTLRVPPVIYTGTWATNTVSTADSGGADAFVLSGTNGNLNFGSNKTLLIKNAGTTPGDASRKAYLRFPLNLPAHQQISTAALTLTDGSVPEVATNLAYDVYGLRYNSAGQNWNETNLTWNNAPGNVTNDSEGVDLSQAIFLGSFITGTNRAIGVQTTFSSCALTEFLNQNANEPVTLIISRLTITSAIEPFASKENTSYAAPFLTYVTMPQCPNQTIGRNTVGWPLSFMVSSTVVSPGSLTVSAHSSNTNLLPVANIVLGGSGANRTALFTPSANQTGVTTVTLSVSDGVATTNSTSFQLTVASNLPPLLTAQPLSGGGFSIAASGNAGPSYTFQASTDLLVWTNLAITNPANSPFHFTDTNAGSLTNRYYRAVVSP